MPKLQTKYKNQLRIIAGQWRNRKIPIPIGLTELRPTPARVRETLFNWLQPNITTATCLDCFAGSGILGLEALSRGAKFVQFIDRSPIAVQHIQTMLLKLACTQANIQQQQTPISLYSLSNKFDIIFIDPPFQQTLIQPTCTAIEQLQLLKTNGLIYIESSSKLSTNDYPSTWSQRRQQQANNVHYALLQKNN